MLALKSVNAADASGETLIFDEIDTGVSGKTSQKIGMRLRALASANQVICVTHSAQIAAEAHHQYLIRKMRKTAEWRRRSQSLNEKEESRKLRELWGASTSPISCLILLRKCLIPLIMTE